MEIIYLSTVCDLKNYEKMLSGCNNKPTSATVVFESALLRGMKENCVKMKILSFPMIPTFPSSKYLYFGGQSENLDCGYTCKWLKTLNLPLFKQASRRIDAMRSLKKWIKKDPQNCVIMTYSIPPFLVKSILKLRNKYNVKLIAVVPDLLRDMYVNNNAGSIITKIKERYLRSALNLQGEYDGYIYLTKEMRAVVAPNKPFMVMEGIADKTDFSRIKKRKKKAIMYAGMLFEKYGIINLLDAFEKLEDNSVELWLFGNGPAEKIVIERAEKNPHIKFFGCVDREKILEYERKATLLVNVRSADDEYTTYSFPSKTIEYMQSGTPVLTTRLNGIPDEYFDYVIGINDNSIETLIQEFDKALKMSPERLEEIGIRAMTYINEEKNAKKQAKKIIDFIGTVVNWKE